ncbi:MAG: hypothetical protein ABJH82_03015 [Polaribacter sp.]|uniref:DUF6913 domain-containing protein n=1 Tax=Polaribacter sp. TaxID=1920175 RepID=UPI003263F422
MNLKKLKESRIKSNFNKKLSKLKGSREVSQNEIQTVAILTTEELSKEMELQLEIETILGVKNSKIYSFKKFNKLEEDSNKNFTEKDVNWKGEFIAPTLKNFLEQPFDLVIGYFNTEHLYLEKAVFQSKATFKVGFSDVNSKLYEIEISEKIENLKQFSLELKKYLKILKKIKN